MSNKKKILTMWDLFDHLAESNDIKFLLAKTCEELTELQEVLLKTLNKIDPHKPSREHLIEELGDVEVRLYMIKKKFGVTQEEILERMSYKADKFSGYLSDGKYKNNV